MSYEYITDTGVIVPDTSDTKEIVENEYKAIFGADLIVDDESPEGLIINAEVEQRDALAKNNADLANQINPNFAEGPFLDAVFAFTGSQRQDGLPTTFPIEPVVGGVAGTVIPAGSKAKTTAGDIFEATEEVVIGGGGTASVQFQSVENAAIQVGPNELTQIIDEVIGWETVTNTDAALPGRERQSDQQARIYRRQTLALQGRSTPEAVFSNVRAVENVASLSFRENVKATTENIDGLTMPPHSVYVCVEGGTDAEVAAALLDSKTAGAQWHNGESSSPVTIDVTEAISGQDYEVLFDRPDIVSVIADFTVSAGSSVVDPVQAVKDAVLAYAAGEVPGEQGFVVGADVSPFELAGAVTVYNPAIIVRNVQVAKQGDPVAPATVEIELFERANITEANISVTVV